MHGSALDRAGPDQRDLHHQVVEGAGLEPGQGGHLGSRFDLEDTDRVGPLQHLVDRRFLQIQCGEIDVDPLVPMHQVDRVVQGGEHAEAKQVEFDQPHRRAIVLVPLQDRAIFHPPPFHRAHLGNRPVADHHSPGMDTQVSREILNLARQFQDIDRNGMFDTAATAGGILDLGGQR